MGVLLIFLFDHGDTFEGGMHTFAPMPRMVKRVFKDVAERRASWWHFAACGFDERPRELRFIWEGLGWGCMR